MSKLQDKTESAIFRHFGNLGMKTDYRPDWLHGLELDIFLDSISTAIEVQGRQHSEFCPHFHKTPFDFELQKNRDNKKYDMCDKAGITLFYVYEPEDITLIIQKIYAQHDFERTTIGTGWISDTKITPLPSRSFMRFQKATAVKKPSVFFQRTICELSELRRQQEKQRGLSKARGLWEYVQEKQIGLTKNQRRIITYFIS